jgi:K+-sensing histidine kinase KdpD
VDIAPELLLERLSAGGIYPAEMIDAALANEFRLGNLFALRQIALIWLGNWELLKTASGVAWEQKTPSTATPIQQRHGCRRTPA